MVLYLIKHNVMNNPMEACALCHFGSKPLLMLACIHDVCVGCAAKNLSACKKVNNEFYYKCSLCSIHTLLDKKVAEELQAGSKQNKTRSQFATSRISPDHIQRLSVQTPPVSLPTNVSMSQPLRGQSDYRPKSERHRLIEQKPLCSFHQQQLNYVCMDCGKRLVCSQCALNGQHLGHSVIHIKRAFPQLKQKAGGWIERLRQNEFLLQNYSSQLEASSKKIMKSRGQAQSVVSRKFKEVKDQLEKIQTQYLQNIQEWAQRESYQVDQQAKTILHLRQEIARASKLISLQLQTKSDYEFLQNFGKVSELVERQLNVPVKPELELEPVPKCQLSHYDIVRKLSQKNKHNDKNSI